jgi:hypothetical protein
LPDGLVVKKNSVEPRIQVGAREDDVIDEPDDEMKSNEKQARHAGWWEGQSPCKTLRNYDSPTQSQVFTAIQHSSD